MSILVHIDRLQKPSMGALAEALVLDRSALAHNLKPLERDGLAKVVIDKGDKRRRHAILTSVGYDKLAEARTLWRGAQARFEAAYGVDRAARLRVELNQIAEDGFAQAFNEAKITPSPQKRGAG
jgi:DNA-binding MarR family transcriptional regulator